MAALITQKFKFGQLENFRNSLANTPYYYLGIAKPFPWDNGDSNPDTPNDNDGFDFPELMSVIKVEKEKTMYVVPRINWRKGDLYDYVGKANSTNYYVLTSTYKVYKCIDVPIIGGVQSPSIIEPTLTDFSIFTTSDNYKWKYLFTIQTADVISFLTNNWMPVRKVTTEVDSAGVNQWNVQLNSIPGTIDKYVVFNGGSGYNHTPTISIIGNGTNATASATISNGVITSVNVTNKGLGYTYAKIVITPHVLDTSIIPAVVNPILSPQSGHGSDAVSELNATSLMLNTLLSFNEGGGDFPITNDYRKIFLMNGLTKTVDNTTATANTYSAMELVKFSTVTYSLLVQSINPDDTIVGKTSGATAQIVEFNSSSNTASIVFKEKDFISNRILTYNISNAGAGYTVGSVLGFTGVFGTGAKAYVTSINGTGGITGLNFDTGDNASRGKNYALTAGLLSNPNEIITASMIVNTGPSPSIAAEITVTTVQSEDVTVYRGSTNTEISGNKLLLLDSEINRSGTIIYKDYRTPITRDINQREQIIIVLGF